MKTRSLTPEEFKAIQAAAWLHGRTFKMVIRNCWHSGAYRSASLGEYEGTLQRMRNSPDGFDVLSSLRTKDFCASLTVARIMGATAAREGGQNPFGLATHAKAWREGYTVARDAALMSGATPRSIPQI